MRVPTNGIEIDVEQEGRGEPVLLIMGVGAQLVHWPDGFCAALTARGFRVIRFDHRDIGRSTWFTHAPIPDVRRMLLRRLVGAPIRVPYTLEDMSDDVAGILDALDLPRAHIVGASMGGMIAQTLAIRHPTRVQTLTSIMSTPGARRFVFGSKPRAIRALLSGPPRTRAEAGERVAEVFRVIGSPGFERDENIMRDLGHRSFDRGLNAPGFARHFGAILAASDRTEALRSVRVPSLVIHGTDDPLIPVAAGRATARAIPQARLLEINGMGHDLPHALWPVLGDAIASIARTQA